MHDGICFVNIEYCKFFFQAMQCTERVSEEMERGRKKLQQDFSSAGLAEVQMKCKRYVARRVEWRFSVEC
jgi:hypothetical protein